MSETHQFCTFHLDNLLFGIEVQRVQEVIRYQVMTRVPLASRVVRGLINLRGQIVTALDLRRRLDMPDRPPEQLPTNVVVRTDGGSLSLLVDEIGDVLEASAETFERAPETLRGAARDLILGTYKLKGQLLLVLDIDRTVRLGA